MAIPQEPQEKEKVSDIAIEHKICHQDSLDIGIELLEIPGPSFLFLIDVFMSGTIRSKAARVRL